MKIIHGIVYRRGSRTLDNLTPRPEKDTVEAPGRAPGLSTYLTLELAADPGQKAQAIDLALLHEPLVGMRDDPELGGDEGHVSIVPIDESGIVDRKLLDEWVGFRGAGRAHPFTQMLLDAIVKPDLRRSI